MNARRPIDIILKDKLGQTIYTVSIKSSGSDDNNLGQDLKNFVYIWLVSTGIIIVLASLVGFAVASLSTPH